MLTIKQIGVVSLAKFLGVLYAGIGLLVGVFSGLISILGGAIGTLLASSLGLGSLFRNSGNAQDGVWGIIFGVGMVILLPILYGAFGFVSGLIFGFLANLALRISGGVELNTKTKK